MKFNLADLIRAKTDLEKQDGDTAVIARRLVDIELKRRGNAGRKKNSTITRQEQNRIAQRKSRDRKRQGKLISKYLKRHRSRNHD